MLNKAEIDGNGNIVIQDSDKSEITINTENSEELKKFLIDFQFKLNELPKEIIDLMESKNLNEVPFEKGANVYLSLNFIVQPGMPNCLAFGVTITNLTKENRFFNSPVFKSSVPIENNLDTFVLIETQYDIPFPKKLEYGEVVTESYNIKPESRKLYEKLMEKYKDATLQVIVSTTVGEIYKSNEYKISKLLENWDRAK
ncbi:MAG: hypothetical protein R6V23_17100 [Bacteroidales bacterium]